MKTTHEIIDEIAAHYNLNNRSVDDPTTSLAQCMYNGPNGKHCAIAQLRICA